MTVVPILVTYIPNLAHQGRHRGGYSPAVGASAVPAGGAIHSVLGRLGHHPPGTMTGARGARWTGTGRGGCHARSNCARSAPPGWGELTDQTLRPSRRKPLARAAPLGRQLPQARTVVGRRQANCPTRAEPRPMVRRIRISVCRRSASFFLFVARMERSVIRERRESLEIVPGFRFAPSGLTVFGSAKRAWRRVTTRRHPSKSFSALTFALTWLEIAKLGRRCAARTESLCFTLPCRGRVAPAGRGVGL